MTMLWIDGFDSYGSENTDVELIVPTGRYISAGGFYVRTSDNTRSGYGHSLKLYVASLRKALVPQADLFVGVAYYHSTDLGNDNDDAVIRFEYDDLIGARTTMCSIFVNGVGGITVTSSTGIQQSSVPNLVFPANWHYIEAKYVPRTNSSGEILVRVDNALVLSVYGTTAAYNTVNVVALPHTSNAESAGDNGINYAYYDDLYILNSEGSAPCNTFLGDVLAYQVLANGDQGTNEGVVSTGSSLHYSVIDEPRALGGDFLTLDTNGQREIFNMGSLPADVIDILAVQIVGRARKDAAGVANYKLLAKMELDIELSPTKTLTSTFLNQIHIMEERPGGGAWTPINFPDLEIGVEAVI